MRKQMVQTVSDMLDTDENGMLLLVDIGVYAFRDAIKKHGDRVKNIGIFESGTVSLAAGLSLAGMVPILYGISPFIVQRSLEQIKLDFVYQNIGGNFITTGASYDFSTLGYSHYCPEDVGTLRFLPGMDILTPATPEQFDILFRAVYNNGRPSYIRMTDYCVKTEVPVKYGEACVLKKGRKATVVAVAETLDIVMDVCSGLDVTVLYLATIVPFDSKTLWENCESGKILVCTPFYQGTLSADIANSLRGKPITVEEIGVPLEVLRTYGTKEEIDQYCGLTYENLAEKLSYLIDKD